MRLVCWKILFITVILSISSVLGLSYGYANASTEIVIKDGTIIPIELTTKTISSKKTFIGEVFEFRVLDGVKVNGVTIIEAGARAYAKVIKTRPADYMVQGGSIELEPVYVIALDGTQVPIKSTIKRTQENRPFGFFAVGALEAITTVDVGGIGGILLTLNPFKGKEAVFPLETKFFVATSGDITILDSDRFFESSIKWSGKWDISSGRLIIDKSGDRIIGRLENGTEVLNGSIQNNEATGNWSGYLFSPVYEKGEFRLVMPYDGNHIKIYWNSGIGERWVTDISAKRIID